MNTNKKQRGDTMNTNDNKKQEAFAGYRYMYQDERVTHRTCLYEYNEASSQELKSMSKFVEAIPEQDQRLKTYLGRYYLEARQDGTTEVDYMIAKNNRQLGKLEMIRSWKVK
jgi:hypothetical protein